MFEALDLRLHKPVAIKLLSQDIAQHTNMLARFRREAIAASRVGHTGIVNVTDFDSDEDGTYFLAMEFLHGEDLSALLRREKRLSLEHALEITIQAALALHAAHQQGIVHRDLKPSNIFLLDRSTDNNIRIKIIDFGISKVSIPVGEDISLTNSGQVLGTPLYMAPEQADGNSPIDHRCDIYALGAILFEMLTGERVFDGTTAAQVLLAHRRNHPRKPSQLIGSRTTSRLLDKVVLRSLAKKPAYRYTSMAALCADLRRVQNSISHQAKTNRWWPYIGILLLGPVVAFGLVDYLRGHPPSPNTVPVAPSLPLSSSTPPEPPTSPPAQSPPSPPAQPSIVTFTLRSVPRAHLTVDGRPIGRTPQKIPVPPESVTVVFSRRGYIPVTKLLLPSDDPNVRIRLVQRRKSPKRSSEENTSDFLRPVGD